ncbi:MAG: hypothetical protein WC444_03095 [Candidatus Paceibacterota bacterium]
MPKLICPDHGPYLIEGSFIGACPGCLRLEQQQSSTEDVPVPEAKTCPSCGMTSSSKCFLHGCDFPGSHGA